MQENGPDGRNVAEMPRLPVLIPVSDVGPTLLSQPWNCSWERRYGDRCQSGSSRRVVPVCQSVGERGFSMSYLQVFYPQRPKRNPCDFLGAGIKVPPY